jgi:hypothetical protein
VDKLIINLRKISKEVILMTFTTFLTSLKSWVLGIIKVVKTLFTSNGKSQMINRVNTKIKNNNGNITNNLNNNSKEKK